MKQSLLFALFLLFNVALRAQIGNAGLGTNTPDPSAKFDIVSQTQGFLMPRMSSAQREAIVDPANGLMVFDLNTNSPWFYNGTAWQNTVVPAEPIPSNLVFSFMSQSGTAQAAETTIGSYVIPASTLNADGQIIEIHAFGEMLADTGTYRFKAGNLVLTFPVFSPGRWDARISMYRIAGGTTKMSGTLIMNNHQTSAFASGNLNFDAAIPFQITAEQNTPLINGLSLEGFAISRVR